MRSADRRRRRREGDARGRQSGDKENTGGNVFQTGTGCKVGREEEEEEESVPNVGSLKKVQLEGLWSVLRISEVTECREDEEEEEDLIILAGRQAHRKSPGESVVEFTGDPSAHARNTVLTFWWRGERR